MLKLSNLESIGKPVYKFQNNHSVDFDGVDDSIDLGEAISYTQHTISTWLKMPNSTPTKVIFDARDAADDGIRLRATGAEKIKYDLNNSSLESTNAFQDEWVHVVATYDGTTQKLYINGALDQSATTSQTISTTTNARIGARSFTSASSFYEGKIDELAIYDRALTADEVTEIYNGGKPTNLKLNSGNYKSADPVIVSTKSVDFDGTDDYLEVGDVGTVKSMSFWFNPDNDITAATTKEQLFGFNGSSYNGIRLGAATGLITGETLTVIEDGNNFGRTATTKEFDAGRWYHIVISWNETATYFDIYVDGVLSTDIVHNTFTLANWTNFKIGVGNNLTDEFNGQIDEVGIFNTALNSDQVIELYNQGVPSNLLTSTAGLDGALVGYWKMGDGTNDEDPIIYDQTNPTNGSELCSDTNFSSASNWNLGSNTTIANNKAILSVTGGSFEYATNIGLDIVNTKTYKFVFTANRTSGTGNLIFGYGNGNSVTNSPQISTSGTQTIYFKPTYNTTDVGFKRYNLSGDYTWEISDFSVKEVNGNPALMQNTPTIVTDAPLTKIRNYYRMGDGILDKFPYINDMISPNLAEITSTNLVTHSTDLNSSFSKSDVTIESNAIISPDGTQNASYVKATSSTSTHLINDVMGTNDVIAMSIHAKQGGYSKFRFNSGSSGNGFASFNLADGTVRTTGGTYFYNAEIEDVGNGWYRCKMVLIGSPGTSLTVAIEDDANQVSFTGDTSKGIYFWGAQGEVQRQVTPLITTTGSTVTRTATIENNYGSMINMSESDITNDVPS